MKMYILFALMLGFYANGASQETQTNSMSLIVEDYYGDLGLGKVKGVRVVSIGDNSLNLDTYLKKGDLILRINDVAIHSTKELINVLGLVSQSPIEIEYSRNGKKNTDELAFDYLPTNYLSVVEYSKSGKLESWQFDDQSQLLMHRGDVKSYSYLDEEGHQVTVEHPSQDSFANRTASNFDDKVFLIEHLQEDKRSDLDKVKNVILIKQEE